MVKKLKYLIFFIPFLFTLNVNAMLLGTPNSYAHFDDDTVTGPSNATIIGYWGSNNYYKSPYLMGGVSSGSYVKQIDFHWNNANLCPNDDISITGSVAGIYNLFSQQSTSLSVYNNNSAMACVTSIQAEGSRLDYSCYGKGGGTLSMYVQMNSFSQVNQYQIGVTRDMTVTCDASNLDVIQNATSNTNSIINNDNQNTQSIIDNQNENTNTLNDSLNSVCKDTTLDITTDLVSESGKYLDPNGALITYGQSYVSKYIKLKPNSTYTIKRITGGNQPSNVSYCLYNANKALYQCSNMPSANSSITINADNYSSFLRVSFIGYRSVQVIGSICNDWEAEGQQDIINSQKETTDAINGLNDSITSEQNPNTNQDINDMNDMVASDTPITDLLTLPMTLINAYYNGINASCSPYNFGNLLGTDIIFPCINLETRLGHNLWMIIDSLCSIFIIYSIAMLFVHAFDSLTSLKDDFDDMYVPRHAGKHVGGGFNG